MQVRGPQDPFSQIAELRRQIRDLQTSRQLGNSFIADGALKAGDDPDNPTAIFGKLPDGTFGVGGKISLQADAVDGMTITGAVTQSSHPGSGVGRWQADPSGIVLQDAAGNTTVELATATGDATVTGVSQTAAPGQYPRAELRVTQRSFAQTTSL